ncbi:MAG: hypothetical protein LAT62_12840, partial [Natronospirillum sp.]|uniref:hypothetical protein n=1 Tax=Natronospirillum sp. TaxID=2812955 RepID=UPI0025F83DA8
YPESYLVADTAQNRTFWLSISSAYCLSYYRATFCRPSAGEFQAYREGIERDAVKPFDKFSIQ